MSIAISAALRGDYALAKAYLTRDPVERALFARLEGSATRYRLVADRHGNDRYDPSSQTISWDPHSALLTTRGGRQSPALGLAHEVDHAVERPSREDALSARRLPRYDTAEERRVIRGSERHAARTLGEAQRFDHRGSLYRVETPVSR